MNPNMPSSGRVDVRATIRRAFSYIGTDQEDLPGLLAAFDGLVEAANRVIWFDWSDNDSDAVASIEQLRAALAALTEPQS